MITIRNSQRKIEVDLIQLRKNIQKMLDCAGYSEFDLGVWLTTNTTIRAYNKKYRKKDKVTDILSFPYHVDLKAGETIVVRDQEDMNLGDIIISLERTAFDARELGSCFSDYLNKLLAHGIAHLLGYDHLRDQDYEEMQKKEKALIKASL